MNTKIHHLITSLNTDLIAQDRKDLLKTFTKYLQEKVDANQEIRLNFICTHNSRRSHLSQVWAQAMAHFYGIPNLFSYSGGTEATAMFHVAAKTLSNQGFEIKQLSEGTNPIHSVKYDQDKHPIICFSKTFDHAFNPKSNFAAIMTCSSADENCPYVAGAEKRIAMTFEDPKAFDNTPQQAEKYEERSVQIATELKYVFSLLEK
ncbi:low molecular weight phosphatase family protein [Aquimarina agarivorans]|uniref:arsenate-mycothiol transferase ArsC n=1 Tax=Aquimarina agarivorans TaxID=980584 RepID=UPI000248EB20|nr:protein-tyrosine-phosphatase [Aquimarina agarivorans]